MEEVKMAKFKVYLSSVQEACLEVEAEDYESAIEAALEEGVPGICAQCSGWGSSGFWRESDEGEWEVDSVSDASDTEVWNSKQWWKLVKEAG
jgi:hypothetical protein